MTGFEPASISFTYPRGMRLLVQVQHCPSRLISNHIPARDVTYRDFIACLNVKPFQSTHPKGVRPDDASNMYAGFRISIHAPARGATWIFVVFVFDSKISIHAPARGATFNIYALILTIYISIHAPARGATVKTSYPVVVVVRFQSTHPRGVRPIETG